MDERQTYKQMVVNIIGLSAENDEGEQGENGRPARAGNVAEQVRENKTDERQHYTDSSAAAWAVSIVRHISYRRGRTSVLPLT